MRTWASLGFGPENVSQKLDLNMAIKFRFMACELQPKEKGKKRLREWEQPKKEKERKKELCLMSMILYYLSLLINYF